ncbi:MAG TPA: hypothetical protein OIM59_12420 [Bacteroides mediterraneensis]|uniref:hypothetical protein n=1 Tax=Bacteroides mediterraneensis TaxID=1841856 RepID=UPI0026EAD42F|nr:hypothetical protein [Bacteroides mediterraneensis]HJH65410.1 hypothetical protein [Bacteroides mediterraneensis]
MKKKLFLWVVLGGMMAFTACTQEKVLYVEEENGLNLQPGEGIIEISLAGAMSRAARPIDHFNPSSPNGNNVNRIGFRVYHLADGNGAYQIDDAVKIVGVDGAKVDEQSLNSYVIEKSNLTNSSTIKIKIKIDENSVHSPYSIVAYGYNCTSGEDFPYTLTNQTKTVKVDEEETEVDIVGLQCDMTNESFPEEIFAGKIEAKVNEYGLFVTENTLTLKRQVAGMLVYLEGVPSHVDNQKVAKVTISTIMDVTVLKFPSDETDNGIAPNGFGKTDLLTFQFKDNTDVSNYSNVSNGGDYIFSRKVTIDGQEENKRYLLPTEMDEDVKQYLDENIECKSNTLFGSCFLLPSPGNNTSYDFGGSNGDWNALNIVYWNEGGNIIKAVPLQDSNSGNTGYSIKRNHFYSIGTKKTADIPGDDDTENPQDDSLDIGEKTGYDYYYVKINDAWDGNFSLTN